MTLYNNSLMTILYLVCFNNDPEIKPFGVGNMWMDICGWKYVDGNMWMEICGRKYVNGNMWMEICHCHCPTKISQVIVSSISGENSRSAENWSTLNSTLTNIYFYLPLKVLERGENNYWKNPENQLILPKHKYLCNNKYASIIL